MNNSAKKARKPRRTISGVRPSQRGCEAASESAETHPALEPIERRALPFTKPFDRRERVRLDPDARIPPHTPLPPPMPEDLPSSLAPKSVPPPAEPQGEPWSASAIVLAALLLVTAAATIGAWLIWSQ